MALLEVSANLKKLFLCSIISFSLTMAVPCLGQDTQGKSQTPPGPAGASGQSSSAASQAAGSLYADYTIGPGDILGITIGDMPDVSGKYRVTDKGYVVLPMLPTPVKAEGLTALGLSKSIGEALRAAELLREPVVSVYVEEVRSRTVLVLGAVQKPSAYPLDKPHVTVLEALSMAGGLLPHAGNTVTQPRQEIPFNVGKLMDGKIGDTQLEPNDILFIPESGRKRSMARIATVAVQGAQGAAFYGLGYRAAGIR